MDENPNNSKAEAIRLLGIAEKLLHNRDLNASRDFAILAQETEPLLDGSDQIVAITDVLLASDQRINNHHDWYAILQIDRRSNDHDLIKRQYRSLALLLHPDKNKFPFADQAFNLVADAWALLSNSSRKSLYDAELSPFTKIDLNISKLPVRRSQPEMMNQIRNQSNPVDLGSKLSTFWTACPYCYRLFEYPMIYQNCCLKCQNCNRAFQAVLIQNLPPMVPGKEEYYCCWSFFPLGYQMGGNPADVGKAPAPAAPAPAAAVFPNWIPPVFPLGQQQQQQDYRTQNNAVPATPAPAGKRSNTEPLVDFSDGSATSSAPKKRGRPRKK